MSLFTSLVSFFAPVHAAEEKAELSHRAPPKIPIKSSYPSGTHTNTTSSWNRVPMSSNQVIFQQLLTIRAASRNQYRSSDYIRRYIRMCRSNIAGPVGIRFQSHAKGIDGRLDIDLAARVEDEVNDWLENGVDFFGEQSWADMIGQVASCWPMDGEVFHRIRLGRGVNRWGIAVETIDPELVNVRDFRGLTNGSQVRFGIEFDRSGRITAYHISPDYGYSSFHRDRPGEERDTLRIRVPADRMLHLFEREFPSQLRGVPWTATAISRTWQIEQWDEAAIVNARFGASKMVFLKSPDGTGMYDSGRWPNGYAVTEVAPGMIEPLPEGVEPVDFDPTYPTNEYESFTKRNLRGAASGLDCSYETLGNDRENVNFSSLRHGTAEDRDTWRMRQQQLIRGLCEPLIQHFFRARATDPSSVFAQLNDYPGQFENVTNHIWQPRTWEPIDQVKEAQAARMEMGMGVLSRSQYMRQRNRDPVETWDEIRKEQELMGAIGVNDTTIEGDTDA